MITLKKLPNKNLLILLNDKEELGEMLKTKKEIFIADLLETANYIGNGWEELQPEDIGALTEAPIIAEDVSRNEDTNEIENIGSIWWFPDYMIKDWIEILYNNGKVEFVYAMTKNN